MSVDYLIYLLIVSIALLLVGLLGFWRETKKLSQRVRVLEAGLQQNHDDLAGICSAAVIVDRRLAANDARLDQVWEFVQDQAQASREQFAEVPTVSTQQGYDSVIQKIRRGISLDELVKECGLTRDEAVLLMRLHGTNSGR